LAGRYRIIERVVESGGMGEVFSAEDTRLGQKVAVKFIRRALERDPEMQEWFRAEVRLARQIAHPNVCRVYDIGEADGVPFLTMEFVDGEDLASLLRRIQHLRSVKATEIAYEICRGLQAIHERGVLHRDLKPGNIMIDGRGHVRITDFGLAALQTAAADDEHIVGTRAYMAPELRTGGAATRRSDLYSLGLVLFEAYTGRSPHEAASALRARPTRREGTQAAVVSRLPELNPKVASVIARCLDATPAQRPASALHVEAELRGIDPIELAETQGITLEPDALARAPARQRAITPTAAGLCGVALVLGLAATLAIGPRTRLVSATPMRERSSAMETRARLLLSNLGFPEPADGAAGFLYDVALVDRVAENDRTMDRWQRLVSGDLPVFVHWHRESQHPMVPLGERQRVTLTDPSRGLPGMVEVRYDVRGRLRRLESMPEQTSTHSGTPVLADWSALFQAAGLNISRFEPTEPTRLPQAFADQRFAWDGPVDAPPPERMHVEGASLGGRPVLFDVAVGDAASATMSTGVQATRARAAPDPLLPIVSVFRGVLLLIMFLVAWWRSTRNLRAGRGDREGARRVGAVLMGGRLAAWVLGGHHTMVGLPVQFSIALAWSLYDFAFARVFYLAVEPHVRRIWPRMLVSWLRLLRGRFDDPLLGRDLLVGCLAGVALGLGVAAHQFVPMAFGLPPGRPDAVGFVEDTLMSTLGFQHQVAQLLLLHRSAVVLTLGCVVVLLLFRLLVRSEMLAYVLSGLVFMWIAVPRGELVALNLVFAAVSTVFVLVVLLRVGLLAAMVALIVHSTLEASVMTWDLLHWPGSTAWFPMALVLALGGFGLSRALVGKVAAP
jgi:serine/threonine-protein kinase